MVKILNHKTKKRSVKMDNRTILSHIDHTLLKPFATWEAIDRLCGEAVLNSTASVCVPPCYVGRIHEKYPDLNICTVIGFPLGYETSEAKVADTVECLRLGASEIDMVINICEVKNKNFQYVRDEIEKIREASKGHVLKVIVETCYLTDDEKKELCHIITETGADYIKTSTGFGDAGATPEDIELFRQETGSNVKIKASGGIRTAQQAAMYIEMGCARIGASSVVGDINA